MNLLYHELLVQLSTMPDQVTLRHDVDSMQDLAQCPIMAIVEKELGLKSTFFFLPFVSETWPDFRYIRNFVAQEQSVGIHIDAGPYMPSGEGLLGYIKVGMRQLGLVGCRCSGHGSLNNHKYGYSYEIWDHYDPYVNKGLGYKGKKYSLSTFSLVGDLSMLSDYSFYLGDSMGEWHYHTPQMEVPVPYEGNLPITKHPTEVIKQCQQRHRHIQVLIHPGYSL